MREPVALGFYPSNKIQLEKAVSDYLKMEKIMKNAKGVVVPHAGYAYSGSTAGKTYASAKTNKKTFVLLGTNHAGLGSRASLSAEDWRTPLGVVKTNTALIKGIKIDEMSHRQEHSLEVQLPFLQVLYNDFEIIPLSLGRLSFHELNKLAEKITDEKLFYIASSDFIHYGPNYGYEPAPPGKALKWTEDVCKDLTELICELKAEEFYNEVSENGYSVCGFVPITLLMLVMKKLGAKGSLIDYKTSYEVSPSNSFVAYAGIVFL